MTPFPAVGGAAVQQDQRWSLTPPFVGDAEAVDLHMIDPFSPGRYRVHVELHAISRRDFVARPVKRARRLAKTSDRRP